MFYHDVGSNGLNYFPMYFSPKSSIDGYNKCFKSIYLNWPPLRWQKLPIELKYNCKYLLGNAKSQSLK